MRERWFPRIERDYGQILSGLTYMRIIGGIAYSMDTPSSEKPSDPYLIGSRNLFSKLTASKCIIEGRTHNRNKLDVLVKLPDSEDKDLRDNWIPTRILKSEIHSFALQNVSDSFLRLCYQVEKIFSTSEWMEEFKADTGDPILISTQDPQKAIEYVKW